MLRRISLVGLVMVGGFAALPASAQTVTCQNAVFSQAVLTRFPNIRQACGSIEQRPDGDVAKVTMRLVRVLPGAGNRVVVRVVQPDGTRSDPITISTADDFRVMVRGQPTRVRDLAVDQDINAYVKVSEPVVALEPAQPAATRVYVPLTFEPTPAPSAPTAQQPTTGTNLPAVLLLGLGLLGAGAGLTSMRKIRRN
jgi:hypothetical protein